MRYVALIIVVALAVLHAGTSQALTLLSRQVLATAPESTDLHSIDVAALSNGNYIAAWYDGADKPEGGRGRARLFSADGATLAELPCSASERSGHPFVTRLDGGEFMLGCEDYRSTLPVIQPWLQRFTDDGVPVLDPIVPPAGVLTDLAGVYRGVAGTSIAALNRYDGLEFDDTNIVLAPDGRILSRFPLLHGQRLFRLKHDALLQIAGPVDSTSAPSVAVRRTGAGRRAGRRTKITDGAVSAHRGAGGVIAAAWMTSAQRGRARAMLFDADGERVGRKITIDVEPQVHETVIGFAVVPIPSGLVAFWSESGPPGAFFAQRFTRTGKARGGPLAIASRTQNLDDVDYDGRAGVIVLGVSSYESRDVEVLRILE